MTTLLNVADEDRVPHGTPSAYKHWKCRCEVCVGAKRERDRAYYAANKDAVKAKVAAYRAANPDKVKERARRHREANRDRILERQREYARENAEAARERSRQWRLDNPEWARANNRAWKAKNREKVREAGREYMRRKFEADPEAYRERRRSWYQTERGRAYRQLANARRREVKPNAEALEWALVIRKDPCSYCGSVGPMELDHIDPVVLGGDGEWDNLAPACRSCNGSKNDDRLVHFLMRKQSVARKAA